MKFQYLKVGDWFEYDSKRFIKIEACMRLGVHCHAVSLASGQLSFCENPTRPILEAEVEPVLKPAWAERK